MSGCAHVVHKCLAYLLSLKRGVPHCSVMAWLRCNIHFSLLRSAVDYLRGTHFHSGCPVSHRALDLALVEGQVPIPVLFSLIGEHFNI